MVGPVASLDPTEFAELDVQPTSDRRQVGGVWFDPLTEAQVVQSVCSALDAGEGGWIATPNVDMVRAMDRDVALRQLIQSATLVVPDGMPVIWAAKLAGTPLPERVTGSSLIFTLTERLVRDARSIYLLGGRPGVPEAAATALSERFPGLRVAGTDSPPLGFEADSEQLERTIAKVVATAPDVVYVGLGSPKQERLIAALSQRLPHSWFVGCGAAIPMAAGQTPRAPAWVQSSGLEWVYRLSQEPTRLAGRYLGRDLPFALRLLATSARARAAERAGR
jgi:N-acetylglucosaminyldiphosphoundecaprenol N-acetyl-beta-D-mannosaminyltransferase